MDFQGSRIRHQQSLSYFHLFNNSLRRRGPLSSQCHGERCASHHFVTPPVQKKNQPLLTFETGNGFRPARISATSHTVWHT
jgi:hypothetical protein